MATFHQPLINNHILGSVYHIKHGNDVGTAVCCLNEAGNECWFTASHVVAGLKKGEDLGLFYKGNWITIPATDVFHHPDGNVDVSAYSIGQSMKVVSPLNLGNDIGAYIGQPVVILGFPHGLIQNDHNLNREFPVAIAKLGAFAGLIENSWGSEHLIDALINPGFSGGPVLITDASEKVAVFGMIKAFRNEMSQAAAIMDATDPQNPKQVPNLYAVENSGLGMAASLATLRGVTAELKLFPKREL